jgi:mutator protein MutT
MKDKPIKGVDYIGVGIGAIIVNSEGKMLLAKRGRKAKNEKGKWEFPGGSVEFGDTMKETIIREMKEELGIEIEPLEHLPAIDHIIPSDGQHWVTSAFISRIVSGEPTIMEPEKCDKIGWFALTEMKNMVDELSIASKQYLPYLHKHQ